jgi:3-phenylpropionate/trans-cinnamate dioxygenase ferredoxin component
MTQHRVASLDEIGVGELLHVEVAKLSICLARLGDREVYAISDTCTHEYASLSEGELYDGSVMCPMHGSLFDVKDGHVTGMPAQVPVASYRARVSDDGQIVVDL